MIFVSVYRVTSIVQVGDTGRVIPSDVDIESASVLFFSVGTGDGQGVHYVCVIVEWR